MSDHAAGCAESFCGAGDETRAVHECGTRHAELDLRAIGYGVEKADEVCFVPCETWVRRGGADLRYADGAAGQSCEEETAGEMSVAGKLHEGLVGVVCCHGWGRVSRLEWVGVKDEWLVGNFFATSLSIRLEPQNARLRLLYA